jgi:3-deoxy-D-manno-octulosonic-acid transferase
MAVFARFVYNLLLLLLSPLLLAFLLWRLVRGKEDRARWGERWGRLPAHLRAATGRPRVWVHAVSVGEVMAAAPVLRELRARFPDALLVVSTITPGGREVAQKQVPPADEVVYFPLDVLPAVRAALARVRPDLVVLMEWEIWPNFLHAAARQYGARIAVLNGRVSDRGLRRGRRGAFFTRPGLLAVDLFAMQSVEDARRAALVGAEPSRIVTLGNTKFDEAVRALNADERAGLRQSLGLPPGASVWVCGSTRPGEEEIIARAFVQARRVLPDLRLIVAPRHIERADEVAVILTREGAGPVARRSKMAGPELGGWDVLLLDTFGELGRVYALADVAFVGGSLLPFGGQSVFQPLAQGAPALFGPHMNNQRDIAALARSEGVGWEVSDADTLAAQVVRLVSLPPDDRAQLGARARALIERNQGVARRSVDALARLLSNETTEPPVPARRKRPNDGPGRADRGGAARERPAAAGTAAARPADAAGVAAPDRAGSVSAAIPHGPAAALPAAGCNKRAPDPHHRHRQPDQRRHGQNADGRARGPPARRAGRKRAAPARGRAVARLPRAGGGGWRAAHCFGRNRRAA